MDWKSLKHEMDTFEKETWKETPINVITSPVDQRIVNQLKSGMDASEVDVIANEEYRRELRPTCCFYKCKEPAIERIMFTSGMSDYYCSGHAAIFEDEVVENREELI